MSIIEITGETTAPAALDAPAAPKHSAPKHAAPKHAAPTGSAPAGPAALHGPDACTPEEHSRALRYVAAHARNADDARALLEALGLVSVRPAVRPRRVHRRKRPGQDAPEAVPAGVAAL